jgi:hypothetical protein
MIFTNRVTTVTLEKEELRDYTCFKESGQTCEQDSFIINIDEGEESEE